MQAPKPLRDYTDRWYFGDSSEFLQESFLIGFVDRRNSFIGTKRNAFRYRSIATFIAMSNASGKKRLIKHRGSSQDEDSDDGLFESNTMITSNNLSKVTGKKRLMKHKSSSQDNDSDDDLFNADNSSNKFMVKKDYKHHNTPGSILENIILNDDVEKLLQYLSTFNITNCNENQCVFITIYDLLLFCCEQNASGCIKQLINTKYTKLMNNTNIINKNETNIPQGKEQAVYIDMSADAYMPFVLLLDGNKDLYYPESYHLLPFVPSQLKSPLLVLLMHYQNTNAYNDTLGHFAFQYPLHCVQMLKLKVCIESCEINRQFPPLLFQLVSESLYFSIYTIIIAINDRLTRNKLSNRQIDNHGEKMVNENHANFTKHSDVLKLLRHQDKNDGATLLHYASEEGIIALVNIILSLDSTLATDEDAEGMTPLMSACMVGHTAVVKELLPVSKITQTDKSGWTAFLYALYSEQADCVLCLLQDNMNTILTQFQALNSFILSSMDHANTRYSIELYLFPRILTWYLTA